MDSDFIKPGEFCFCPRCGSKESCQLGDKPIICIGCGPQDLVWPADPTEKKVLELKIEVQKSSGLIMYSARQKIAELRMAGV